MEDDEVQPLRSKGSIPRVVYQRVDAELDFSGEALFCSTTMVLAFPQLTLDELFESKETLAELQKELGLND